MNLKVLLLFLGKLLEKTKLLTCSFIVMKNLQLWYLQWYVDCYINNKHHGYDISIFSANRVEIRLDIGSCLGGQAAKGSLSVTGWLRM